LSFLSESKEEYWWFRCTGIGQEAGNRLLAMNSACVNDTVRKMSVSESHVLRIACLLAQYRE
jgi:hypothetical protein